MVISNQSRWQRDKKQGLSSTMAQISKHDWCFCCPQWLLGIANNGIDAITAVHCFQILTLFQNVDSKHFLRVYFSNFTHKSSKKRAHDAYTICWYRCTADPLCIHVGAAKRFMLLMNNIFMQYFKSIYLSITAKTFKQFRPKMIILSFFLDWL